MKKTNSFILGSLILLVSMALSFGVVAGIYWLICWSFSIQYSLRVVLGVWIIWTLVTNLIKSKKKE